MILKEMLINHRVAASDSTTDSELGSDTEQKPNARAHGIKCHLQRKFTNRYFKF